MNIQIPEEFVHRMRDQLGNELSAFLHALDKPPLRGIRFNPLKPAESVNPIKTEEKVPWEKNGFYLPSCSDAGSTVLHEAGAFYIQEPGAMMPAAVLDARPGERILDLCAAPGGKSTQIGCSMMGRGLLICNEPVPKRAAVLSRNIERTGLPNTLVTCAFPEQLAEKWPEAFDAVLVDAPCSGEGMFRRDPDTRSEWTAEKAEGCAARQREILTAASRLVRPGGRLVYSTCTYNPAENEGNAIWFTEQFPDFTLKAFVLPEINAPTGMFTCYPHRIHGEGQFAALFKRAGEGKGDIIRDNSLKTPSAAEKNLFHEQFPFLPEATHMLGSTMIHMPELPDIKGIRIIRAGLHLGEVHGKIPVPDHAAAMCFKTTTTETADLTGNEAVRFIAGETIPSDARGWVLARYCGLALGWAKGNGGVLKNHYPKGLRTLHTIP